uniref:ribonuclease Z n=1 Tax=Agathobacter sp. TaxID=2021311 RepID=UPI004055BEE6
MNIFVCLDEKGGMMFNKRRQSSDRVIRADILQTVGGHKLYVNSYTAKQFTEENNVITIADNCLAQAGADDYVFVENMQVGQYLADIQQIIVYRWDRKYPADFFFDVELSSTKWVLLSSEEMEGYSHECIGKEVYTKISKERIK